MQTNVSMKPLVINWYIFILYSHKDYLDTILTKVRNKIWSCILWQQPWDKSDRGVHCYYFAKASLLIGAGQENYDWLCKSVPPPPRPSIFGPHTCHSALTSLYKYICLWCLKWGRASVCRWQHQLWAVVRCQPCLLWCMFRLNSSVLLEANFHVPAVHAAVLPQQPHSCLRQISSE